MSTPYVVTYDLSKPGQNYGDLIDALNSYGYHWHMMQSTWIIATSESASQIVNKLKQHIDSNDKLFVGQLSGQAAWVGLSDKGTEWLKNRLEAQTVR